jgi:hypothetical protein
MMEGHELDSSGSGLENCDTCEHGNEPSNSIKKLAMWHITTRYAMHDLCHGISKF